MKGADDNPQYKSFVLVCWVDSDEESLPQNQWRYRLEDPHSGARWGFLNLIELAAFLQSRLDGSKT
jgi:hypothetical protein